MLASFLSYYRPWRALFLLDFGCAILSGLLELAFPLAIKAYIDRLLPSGDLPLILLAAAGLLVVYIVNAGLMAIVTYWGHMLGINIETEMRRKAFDQLQRLSFAFYDRQRTGTLVSRVTRDLEEIGEVAHHGPEDLFVALMTFVGAFVLMLYINVELGLITAVIFPACVVLITVYGRKLTQTWHEIYSNVAKFNVRLEENVGGMRVVQSFANEAHEKDLFAQDNANYRRTKLHAYLHMAASTTLNYMGMRLVQVAVLVAGAVFVAQGELSIGGFVAFLLLVGVFFRPLDKIAAVMELYPRGLAGFKRYRELMALEPDVAERPDARDAPMFRGEIAFENVAFSYDRDMPVLADISLTIAAGETVAIVGQSGAGKSTLVSLVPRFYDPQAGRIRIDGTDIRTFTLQSLRRQIGVVSQDVFLFGGTLRENVAYGRLGATEEEIRAALDSAQLTDLVASLPDGLDTVVGERGVALSGGQKQRVAIARTFLKDPPILILDEATSALDLETEMRIQSALNRLSEGRTSLVIAHRPQTIRDADRVLRVENGQLVPA